MSKSNKKPRVKFNPRSFEPAAQAEQKKDKDWSFDDIVRSKSRRRS
ncbi:MAG: hypothetical protein HQL27_06425 [Candidatus Omnitrophica bacterium]|nr:hypothetical protein [Candidatus Omnitrophota bacterium]